MAANIRQQYYRRFGAAERMEHMALLVSFTVLALTGLPQRYADTEIARTAIDLLGGIESVRVIHRVFAVILMATSIYHGGAVSYKVFVRGSRLTMVPGRRDVQDAIGYVLNNLGLRKSHPEMPRYNFGEKVEYLAVVWGTIIMIITGFMMWNPIATAKILPGVAIPAARAAHSAEALLAVLSIIIWHMYNVHIKRFNRSMFTGNLSRKAMQEEHAEELKELDVGNDGDPVSPAVVASRRGRFIPVALVITFVLTVGLYMFVTFEESAITTVPRRDVVVFLPQAVEDGNAAIGEELWPSLRCARCHAADGMGIAADGIPPARGTDLSFEEFYLRVREGGEEMPSFGTGEIPDSYLSHLWAWLSESTD